MGCKACEQIKGLLKLSEDLNAIYGSVESDSAAMELREGDTRIHQAIRYIDRDHRYRTCKGEDQCQK